MVTIYERSETLCIKRYTQIIALKLLTNLSPSLSDTTATPAFKQEISHTGHTKLYILASIARLNSEFYLFSLSMNMFS